MPIPKDNTQKDRKALSVTFGDSSPRGRAKGGCAGGGYRDRYAPFYVLRPRTFVRGRFVCVFYTTAKNLMRKRMEMM